MTELIKIIRNEQGSQAVSARELHECLEIATDFTDWCKRMFEYGFEENVDYSLLKIGERYAHNKVDYALTMEVAKHIAMIQRTDKGKQVRQYFIECERILKEKIATNYNLGAGRVIRELQEENAMLKYRLGEGPKPETVIITLPSMKGRIKNMETKDLIKTYFEAPKQGDKSGQYLSATEICRYLKEATGTQISLRSIGLAMWDLDFKQDNKMYKGVKKRGYYVDFKA